MKRVLIERNRYFDSVFLMRISHELEQLPDVGQAIVAMGTPANLANLADAGFVFDDAAGEVFPQDLVIAIDAASEEAIAEADDHLRLLLTGPTVEDRGTSGGPRPMTIADAVEIDPETNLALISVPGTYAAREARNALQRGLHVMLFSDNVSTEEEIALKDEAIERGLLMMGPDCGTAILSGAPLGFANVVRRGSIGIVGASGTGIQEISSLVDRLGSGISQAIGTGGRDLSSDVGGRMILFGIDALADDPATEVIVVVSKAPAPYLIPTILERLEATGKPSIAQFVGWDSEKADPAWLKFPVQFATTLEEAAKLACTAVGIDFQLSMASPTGVSASAETPPYKSASGRLVGLFCGGTLAQEAWSLLHNAGIDAVSNVAFEQEKKVSAGTEGSEHAIWDLGDDAFTVGKPHPMIEPSLRDDEVACAGSDASIGIVLVDCVLGYGSHPDPAGSLADAARQAIDTAREDGRELLVIAAVTGTDADPQDRTRQVARLTDAGVLIAPSNADATRRAIDALKGGSDG